MAIEHSAITDPNIHEPKGVSTALAKRVYVADGSGSGAWSKLSTQSLDGVSSNGTLGQSVTAVGDGTYALKWAIATGSTYFTDFGTAHSIPYPSAATKVNPGTTPGGAPVEFSEGINARLTYTGTPARKALVEAVLNFSQADATDRDIRVSIYKNGVAITNSEVQLTCEQNKKKCVSTSVDVSCVTNDYFEVYVQNMGAAGAVNVVSLKLTARGLLN